jgi:hypothetical protein
MVSLHFAGLALGWLTAIAILVPVAFVFFDYAQPPDSRTSARVISTELRSWDLPRSQIHKILIVQRGDYAAVATSIDLDNVELLKRTPGGWVRITPNGWADNIDKWAIYRDGVPWWTANALGNGILRLWHIEGYNPG